MWRVRNESTGKEQVWYEAELIDRIKDECIICDDCFQTCTIADRILDLIEQYEKEDS